MDCDLLFAPHDCLLWRVEQKETFPPKQSLWLHFLYICPSRVQYILNQSRKTFKITPKIHQLRITYSHSSTLAVPLPWWIFKKPLDMLPYYKPFTKEKNKFMFPFSCSIQMRLCLTVRAMKQNALPSRTFWI